MDALCGVLRRGARSIRAMKLRYWRCTKGSRWYSPPLLVVLRLFHGQNHFADIFPLLNISVRRSGLRQRKGLPDDRLDLARSVHAKNLIEFAAQQRAAGLQAPEIHADHGNITAHQLHGMKPGDLGQRFESSSQTPLSVRPRGGGKVVNHPPDSVRRELAHTLDEIVLLIINRMIYADLAQIFLLCGPRRAENHQATGSCKLHGGDLHATSRPVDQYPVSRLQVSHRKHRVICGEVIYRDRGGIVEGHARGQAIHLAPRNGHPCGIGVELRERSYCFADSQRLAFRRLSATIGNFLDYTRNFESRNEGRLGRSGVNSHALQQVREVYADGFHANQRFSRLELRVGEFARFKNFRGTILPYDHGAHLSLLVPLPRWDSALSPAFHFGFEASYLKL